MAMEVEGRDPDKDEFLQEFGEGYGYPDGPKSVDQIRASEFSRLDGLVYLDHAGATLYSELQMEAVFRQLTANVYGNPHSQSDSSMATADIVREARQQVLEYFNASPKYYRCIFTSGATAALKLVGEAFPWSHQSCFMYTMENHNSVLGIREYALEKGAAACAVDIEEDVRDGRYPVKISQHPLKRRFFTDNEPAGAAYSLFAMPSECNFSGVRFNLDLVRIIKEDSERVLEDSHFHRGKWMVLIDAAKGCATRKLDLSKYPADFVVLSFYKLFGYPTGLGALIVHETAAKLLRKTYFSGGTVAASMADVDFVKRREGIEESLENGTLSFLSISSIRHGFKVLNSLSMEAISRHTESLSAYLRKTLSNLRHENGDYVCILYGVRNSVDIGPTVSFNLKRPDGSWYGYREVEKLASLSGIQLRTGCFCNPGACAKYLGLSHQDLLSNVEAGHVCWDDNDVLHGKPTGAVRVSFGYMSTYEDAKKFIDFIKKSFVCMRDHPTSLYKSTVQSDFYGGFKGMPQNVGIHVKSIIIYPIKSCTGFSVESWPLSSTGLLHDREWLLKSLAGEILTLKKVPELCSISAFVDLNLALLIVESPRCKEKLVINIKSDSFHHTEEEIGLHAQRYVVHSYDEDVNTWFSNATGRPCILLRSSSSNHHIHFKRENSVDMCRDVKSRLNFSNEAQFLLISEESMSDLDSRVKSNAKNVARGASLNMSSNRFRPNLVVAGAEPYAEDTWKNLRIGGKFFTSLGGCNRCQVINLINEGGRILKSNEPLATLASYRRMKGKILFGILLRCEGVDEVELGKDLWLRVGDEVHPDENLNGRQPPQAPTSQRQMT
ncbi:molybdenum cofactor sulfurase [Syzygium oleosum]|uniref:molybdenum cofactor sulfurase n=1 Tax=Syzygium oleosum TaxID=219896 RepID=UPI0011D2B592|nr:molybdenum cofactor sulfurase [Syzygium oleosum]